MQLIITLDESVSTGRTHWHVQSDLPVYDGAATASSLDDALTEAADWIKECDKL